MARKPLGRGLEALLSDGGTLDPEPSAAAPIALRDIHRSRYQPRRHFDDAALTELSRSIGAHGLMQPVVLRSRPQGGYELVAGERRLRAAGLAGLEAVPAIVREVSDEQAAAMALIENVQREDLRPLEEAEALRRLRDEFGLTQQAVADAVGKSREAVANLLRLLNLDPTVRELLDEGALEMGHARALLPLPTAEQIAAAQQTVRERLNVRQTEALVRRLLAPDAPPKKQSAPKDPDTLALERRVTERLGAPVTIAHDTKGAGRMTIRYASLDELDGILGHLLPHRGDALD
ncbi:MAG: ParB/RepB/Spo0J family partition protein [Gammaproteobacteria bacterium]|nr:ParB/RepB/Spo0J family partition protein [Gammaproteobacteria bacterium]